MTAGTAASLIRVPTEVIKQRLQTKEFSGASSAVSNNCQQTQPLEPCRRPCSGRCGGWRRPRDASSLLALAEASTTMENAMLPLRLDRFIMQVRHVLAKEGVRGLYAGYGAFMMRDLPFDAIEFFVYEQVRGTHATVASVTQHIDSSVGNRQQWCDQEANDKNILSLQTVQPTRERLATQLLLLVFCMMQLKRGWTAYNKRELYPQETSLIGAFAGGFTGRKHSPCYPCVFTWLSSTEILRLCILLAGQALHSPHMLSMQCPHIGNHAGLVTTPLDVLKTRLMVQGQTGRYTSVFHAMSRIAREEGLGAFMKGWQPRLIWISLGGFVYFPVLEGSKKLFAPAPASTASGHK